ncbi:MAG: purine-nucleoside phosphorylase [Deltaproteobacteria bacterium]|nr:purine-nucleoside phosphorylase [Deltaproteobacteria bacterium]
MAAPSIPGLAAIRAHTDFVPEIAVVLGSGLSAAADRMTPVFEMAYAHIHASLTPGVAGHAGRLVFGTWNGRRVAAFCGRTHLYEGRTPLEVTLPVRLARGLGAKGVLLTSSVGALDPELRAGDAVLIEDHYNAMGDNPIRELVASLGAEAFQNGRTPFADPTGMYQTKIFERLRVRAEEKKRRLSKGVLAAVLGPVYETPAERRALRVLGGDVVCMSLVPEALMARYLGMKIVALALVTNGAVAGTAAVTHDEVLRAASEHAKGFTDLLEAALEIYP